MGEGIHGEKLSQNPATGRKEEKRRQAAAVQKGAASCATTKRKTDGLPDKAGAGRRPSLQKSARLRRRPLQLWDEELEGAGDDAEFDGEARERLAVNLRIDGIRIERFAEEGIGFEEFDAGGAAELIEPKRRQITEIAEAAARCEREDFEAVFEEIGFGGDFEGAAIVLRAADDDERRVDFAIAADDAEMLKFVANNFADSCPPIRENADARFQAEVDGVDDPAVGAGAGDAEKIFFLFGLLERSGEAERDFFYGAVNELFGGARNVPGKIEFLGEDVGGAAGKKRERDAVAVLMGGEAVDDFVERAVTAAGDDEAALFGGGARGDFGGVTWAGGFGEVGVNAARGEDVARFVELAATAVAAAAGVGIVDEKRVLEVGGHLGSV